MLKRGIFHYTGLVGVGMFSLLFGASIVHTIFKPDLTIPKLGEPKNRKQQ